jgi:DNA-binding NarL/FixJ family response regulator
MLVDTGNPRGRNRGSTQLTLWRLFDIQDVRRSISRNRSSSAMGKPSVRVLVAEDFAPFRQFVRLTLDKRGDLQVVCEVSDGQEAIQKAAELKPHLILLDIGLPRLNGIEAARQVRELSPDSKIIVVSEESSLYVVQEALSLGVRGYVTKRRASIDLLAAVEAVLEGRQFVTQGLLADGSA